MHWVIQLALVGTVTLLLVLFINLLSRDPLAGLAEVLYDKAPPWLQFALLTGLLLVGAGLWWVFDVRAFVGP